VRRHGAPGKLAERQLAEPLPERVVPAREALERVDQEAMGVVNVSRPVSPRDERKEEASASSRARVRTVVQQRERLLQGAFRLLGISEQLVEVAERIERVRPAKCAPALNGENPIQPEGAFRRHAAHLPVDSEDVDQP
jgi:hypothetical protein